MCLSPALTDLNPNCNIDMTAPATANIDDSAHT